MKRINKYCIVILLLFLSNVLRAQSDLEIRKVFEEYGKKKGTVMVELNGRMAEDYDFKVFKSLTINDIAGADDFIRKCLLKDEAGAKKVKQVVRNGKLISIILLLNPKNNVNRIILFNESTIETKKLTLIYIESELNADDILKFTVKKK
jgi:hypothetical protein